MITSLQNAAIKNIVKLAKSRERKAQQLFVLEGARELSLALQSRYSPEVVYLCREMFEKTKYPKLFDSLSREIIVEISLPVFEKIAYRENSDGVVAVMHQKQHELSHLRLTENPFLVVLESVEKPGNLGAILRTADAAAIDGVIVCDPHTDLYNANVVRSSVGGIFTVQTAVCSSEDAFEWLQKNKIASYAAELQAADFYQETDFTSPSAIVMGTEADGLSPFWLTNATKRIKIPMRGRIDSLNVSVSTAVLTFEAMRQRGF